MSTNKQTEEQFQADVNYDASKEMVSAVQAMLFSGLSPSEVEKNLDAIESLCLETARRSRNLKNK